MKTNKWINLIASIALITTMTGCNGEDGGEDSYTDNNDNTETVITEERIVVSSNDYYVTELSRNKTENIGMDRYALEVEAGIQTYEEFYGTELACVLNLQYGVDTYINDAYLTNNDNANGDTFDMITDEITPRPTASNIEDLITKWGWDRRVKVPACDVVIITNLELSDFSELHNVNQEELLNRAKVASTYYKSQGAKIAMYKADYDYFTDFQVIPEISLLVTDKNNIKDFYADFRISNGYDGMVYFYDANLGDMVIGTYGKTLTDLGYTLDDAKILEDEWDGTVTDIIYNPETSLFLPDVTLLIR